MVSQHQPLSGNEKQLRFPREFDHHTNYSYNTYKQNTHERIVTSIAETSWLYACLHGDGCIVYVFDV